MEEKENLNLENNVDNGESHNISNQVTEANMDTNGVLIQSVQENNVASQNNEVNNNVSQFEEVIVEKKVEEIRTDSYFDGKLIELIGWNFLRYLITIVTLGIAAPWAECMIFRYKINHTILNGKRMNFIGRGGDYFVEKFKWIFFTIITLGIYAFWIPIKKKKWIISNIHFNDEAYVLGESFFDGKLIQLIGINILCNFLNIVSFGILFPFTICLKLRWISKHTIINRKKIVFAGTGFSLLGNYLLWLFLTFITFGIFGWWLGIKIIKWDVKNSHIKTTNEVEVKDNILLAVIICLIVGVIGFIAVIGIIMGIYNNSVNNLPNGFDSDTMHAVSSRY